MFLKKLKKAVGFLTASAVVTAVIYILQFNVCAENNLCGDSIKYSVSGSGALSLSGTGSTYNYIPSEIPWKESSSSISSVSISDGITSLGVNIFLGLPNVKSVTLPSSVSYISTHALGYVQSGDGYAKVEGFAISAPSGSAAEAYCSENGFTFNAQTKPDITGKCGSDLSWSLAYNGTLTVSGKGAMYDFTSSESSPWYSYSTVKKGYTVTSVVIEEGVTTVGAYAFSGCVNLRTVSFPGSLTRLGQDCFSGCCSLESVKIPSSVKKIPKNAFYVCTSLSEIKLSDGTESIGESAFLGTGITELAVPGSVTDIADNAFYGCDRLEAITIQGVKHIGNSSFADCEKLKTVSFPDSLVSIGSGAFMDCASITALPFREGIETIGDDAFFGCTAIKTLTLPDSVKSLGSFAFSGCTSLSSVNVGNGCRAVSAGCFDGCDSLFGLTLGNSVEEIGERAFTNCKQLISVRIPASVKYIFPKSIGYYFYTDEISETGAYAEYSDFTLEIISNSPSAAEEYAKESGFVFTDLGPISEDSGYVAEGITWSVNNATNVFMITGSGIIPDYITFTDTPWRFYKDHIETVVIGSGIEKIGSSCFEGCTSLTAVSISGTVTEIGDSAFAGTSLESVSIPKSVATIYDGAFENCSMLRSVYLVDGLQNIGQNAFRGNDQLKSVFIPESVLFVGAYAFGFDGNDSPVDGFIIRGVKNSSAEDYAASNSIDFRENGFIKITDSESGASVDILGSSARGLVLSLTQTASSLEPEVYLSVNEYAILYDLSLIKDEENYDFEGQATVRFPLPENVNPLTVRLYSVDNNSEFTEIRCDIDSGCLVFAVENLGTYAVTNADLSALYNVEIRYLFSDGIEAAPAVMFRATSGTGYKIHSNKLNGFTPDMTTVTGTVESSDISVDVIYSESKVTEEDSSAITDETTDHSEKKPFEGTRRILFTVIIILVIVLIAAGAALVVLNRKHTYEKKEKERIVSREVSAKPDKYAKTIVIPDNDQATKEIDIQSLFAEEPEEDTEAEKNSHRGRRKK